MFTFVHGDIFLAMIGVVIALISFLLHFSKKCTEAVFRHLRVFLALALTLFIVFLCSPVISFEKLLPSLLIVLSRVPEKKNPAFSW